MIKITCETISRPLAELWLSRSRAPPKRTAGARHSKHRWPQDRLRITSTRSATDALSPRQRNETRIRETVPDGRHLFRDETGTLVGHLDHDSPVPCLDSGRAATRRRCSTARRRRRSGRRRGSRRRPQSRSRAQRADQARDDGAADSRVSKRKSSHQKPDGTGDLGSVHRNARATSSARCTAVRPEVWAIWVRQLKPSETTTVSSLAARIAGSRRSSAQATDTS